MDLYKDYKDTTVLFLLLFYLIKLSYLLTSYVSYTRYQLGH